MLKVEEQEVAALAVLRNSPDFQIVLEWMRRTLDKHDTELRKQRDDTQLRQTQGKAQELNEMISAAEGAEALIKRMRP